MGVLDKAKGFAKGKKGQIKEGVDKTGDVVKKKVGGKNADKVNKAKDATKGAVDKI